MSSLELGKQHLGEGRGILDREVRRKGKQFRHLHRQIPWHCWFCLIIEREQLEVVDMVSWALCSMHSSIMDGKSDTVTAVALRGSQAERESERP